MIGPACALHISMQRRKRLLNEKWHSQPPRKIQTYLLLHNAQTLTIRACRVLLSVGAVKHSHVRSA
jgi:hypothetical protein